LSLKVFYIKFSSKMSRGIFLSERLCRLRCSVLRKSCTFLQLLLMSPKHNFVSATFLIISQLSYSLSAPAILCYLSGLQSFSHFVHISLSLYACSNLTFQSSSGFSAVNSGISPNEKMDTLAKQAITSGLPL